MAAPGQPAAVIADTALRRATLIKLRRGRVPYEEIVTRLGYSSENAARKDFSRAKKEARELVADEADAMRDLISENYDALINAYLPSALAGEDVKAAELVRKVLVDQAKLWGVNAPIQVEATMQEVSAQDLELRDMINAAKARIALEERQLKGDR
jgi:hypothetical protein